MCDSLTSHGRQTCPRDEQPPRDGRSLLPHGRGSGHGPERARRPDVPTVSDAEDPQGPQRGVWAATAPRAAALAGRRAGGPSLTLDSLSSSSGPWMRNRT